MKARSALPVLRHLFQAHHNFNQLLSNWSSVDYLGDSFVVVQPDYSFIHQASFAKESLKRRPTWCVPKAAASIVVA